MIINFPKGKEWNNMKRKTVCGRILSVILAATLALSPSTTVVATASSDAGQYEALSVEGEDSTDEGTAAGEEKSTEEAVRSEALDEGTDGASSEAPAEDETSEEGASETEGTLEEQTEDSEEEEAGDLEAEEPAAEEAVEDAAATAEEESEELEEAASLLTTTPSGIPAGAVQKGDPQDIGTNLKGQIYTWKDASDNDHTGLYIYSTNGAGFEISESVKKVFSDDKITDVIFGAEITTLGQYAFDGCDKLKTIELPSSLETIKMYAFKGCTSLESITIPRNVKDVDWWVFRDCTSLTEVTFEDGMTKIPENMLSLVEGGGEGYVKRVNIPASATIIGEGAFRNQKALKSVNFAGDNLLEIENWAFAGTGIEKINLSDGVNKIGSGAFSGCNGLKGLELPSSLETIGLSAFENCTGLESITIPRNVKHADWWAFKGCTSLTEVTFEDGMTKIPDNILSLVEGGGTGSVKTVNIPASVTIIGNSAFVNQNALKNVNFAGDNLLEIGNQAFAGTGIEEIDLPDGVTKLGQYAFSRCSRLKALDLSSSLETIEINAFEDCTSLESITIPKKVRDVSWWAFKGCISLTEVTFEDGMTKIPDYMLSLGGGGGTGYVRRVYIPASVKSIGKSAFKDQNNLKTVYYKGSSKTKASMEIGSDNEPLINAEWVFIESVEGVSLDSTYVKRYAEDLTTEASSEITLNATVIPANASVKDVTVSLSDTDGNAVKSVTAGAQKDGVTPINVKLTGNTGKAVVAVTTKEGGFTASCTIVVREKETALTPVFYLNGKRVSGKVEMLEGDRLTVGGLSAGAKAYYGFAAGKADTEFTDALIGGEEIKDDTTVYVLSKGEGLKDSEIASIEVTYSEPALWGDITDADAAEFGGDVTKVPQGPWIPLRFLTDSSIVYTGSKVTLPEYRVYYGNRLLAEGTDYSLGYRNNVNAAARDAATHPAATITLKGNYGKSTTDVAFTINQREILKADSAVTAVLLTETADKKALTADPKLKVEGKALKQGTDYTIEFRKTSAEGEWSDTVMTEGVYDVKVTGRGNYCGDTTFEKLVQVAGANSVKIGSLTISKPENKTIPVDWNGDQDIFAQNLTVKYKGADVDETAYNVVLPTITKAGKYTAVIEGSGTAFAVDGKDCYITGSKTFAFTVSGSAAISKADIALAASSVTYSPEGNEIAFTVEYNGKELTEGKDFTAAYKNTQKAGTATLTLTGLGAFTGSAKKTYKINKANIADVKVVDADDNEWKDSDEKYSYTKGGTKPGVYLKGVPSEYYTVTYSNNKAVAAYDGSKKPSVRITGKGNYTGTKSVYFSIVESDISDLDMTVSDLIASSSPKKYTQTPVILDINGSKLSAGTDYDKDYSYTYAASTTVMQKTGSGKAAVLKEVDRLAGEAVEDKDIIPAGTMIRMAVKGKGNYTGSISETYMIADSKISALKFSVKYPEGRSSFTYTGKPIRPGKASIRVQVKSGSSWVDAENSSAYYDIVSYKNNTDKGTATITIKGKNGFAGTANITFKITAR
jgi:hypothetical protein